jgi:pectate lyase
VRTNICALGLIAFATACGSDRSEGAQPVETAGAGGGSGGPAPQGSGAGSDANRPELPLAEPGVTILQEDELGFAAVDGKVLPRQGSTSITGFTGTGFADSDSGFGKAMSWSVSAEQAGSYGFVWRYAFGGTATNLRDARLLVNGAVVAEAVVFPYTNSWDEWHDTEALQVPLSAGNNFIQLQAVYEGGLANIDYLKIIGEGVTGDVPSFSLGVDQNTPAAGSFTITPQQDFYPAGTMVTLTATANAGYFFQSWSGDASSNSAEFSFTVSKNTRVTALFLPEGTVQDPELVGYASVQDDAGTSFIVTGGSLGPTVRATTLQELQAYLGAPGPQVVELEGLVEGAEVIDIASDKTLLGVGAAAHLRGIELQVNGSRNVIIRNVAVSHVVAEGAGTANDAIAITGGARNVWVDRCELYSDLDNGVDYYDGLLEIKNEASFVTVSRSVFHDHFKVSLISSGDQQVGDTVIRATFHHNYFYNVGSRLPSIRFGKAHVFNNYYRDNTTGSGVNTRMGAVVRVENNYFQNTKNPIGHFDSPITGTWDVSNNVFDACTGTQPSTSTGSLAPPYQYSLDDPASLPTAIPELAGVGRL